MTDLPAPTDSPTAAAALSGPVTPSFSDLDLTVLDRLPRRLSDSQLAAVERIATCPLPAVVPCDDRHFAKCIRSLATLPGREGDELTSALRVKLYRAKLGGFSAEAMSILVSRALERCTFFPTIAECLALLAGWDDRHAAIAAQGKAMAAAGRERQQRMEGLMLELARGALDAAAIAALPEGLRAIAETRGLLWNDGDGRYRPRPDRALLEREAGTVPAAADA